MPVVVTPVVLVFAPHIYDNLAFLTTMIVYVVLAEGVNLLYGFTGYLPFGYVGFFGAGAYGAALSLTYWHVPGIAALAIGGLVAAVIGLVLSPLLRLSGAYFALATLAASQVLYYIVANEPWTYGETGTSLPEVFSPYETYVVALVIMAVAIAFTVFVKESRFGLSLRAIRSDPVSASMAGINVVRTRSVAWFISAALAGLAGAMADRNVASLARRDGEIDAARDGRLLRRKSLRPDHQRLRDRLRSLRRRSYRARTSDWCGGALLLVPVHWDIQPSVLRTRLRSPHRRARTLSSRWSQLAGGPSGEPTEVVEGNRSAPRARHDFVDHRGPDTRAEVRRRPT